MVALVYLFHFIQLCWWKNYIAIILTDTRIVIWFTINVEMIIHEEQFSFSLKEM